MILVSNRKAVHDYEILQTFIAGIQLTGAEVKSLRQQAGSLAGSYVKIIQNEAVLLNAQISPYPFANNQDYDPKRTRKLLLKKSEIYHVAEKLEQKGYTLIPLSIETIGRHIKVKIGLGRGKKVYEHRQELRRRAMERDAQREVKEKLRLK